MEKMDFTDQGGLLSGRVERQVGCQQGPRGGERPGYMYCGERGLDTCTVERDLDTCTVERDLDTCTVERGLDTCTVERGLDTCTVDKHLHVLWREA